MGLPIQIDGVLLAYSKYGKRQELDWLLELTRNSEIF